MTTVLFPPWFFRTLPFPDELAFSYQITLVNSNGYSCWDELVKQLSSHNNQKIRLSAVLILSECCSMTVPDFVCHHTIRPFARAFTHIDQRQPIPHGCEESDHLRHGLLRLARKELYVCPACAQEDRVFLGRSYWRRSHQIPGVDWCPKHGVGLLYCDRSKARYEPLDVIEQAIVCTDSPYPECGSVARRYIELVGLVLEQNFPFPMTNLKRLIRERIKNAGLSRSRWERGPLFSYFVLAQSPNDWLMRLGLSSNRKHAHSVICKIDGVADSAPSPQSACLLALAVLYANPKDALNNLYKTNMWCRTRHEGEPTTQAIKPTHR